MQIQTNVHIFYFTKIDRAWCRWNRKLRTKKDENKSRSFRGIDNFRLIDDFRGVVDYSDEFTAEKNFVQHTHEPSKTEKNKFN